jgi:hypothetical protein
MSVCPPAGPVAPVSDLDAPAPDALIACVDTTPITGALFGHWLSAARKGSPEGATASELRSQVLEFLVSAKWLEGEAAERGIMVSDRAVRRQLREQRQAGYPDKRKFRKFLEDSGMTRSDLKYRVRVDILSERVRADAAGTGSQRSRTRRLSRFVERFRTKWKRRTACLPSYEGDSCGGRLATA